MRVNRKFVVNKVIDHLIPRTSSYTNVCVFQKGCYEYAKW